MTDKAVSALTSLTGANAATGDLLYIVDISEASAADRSKKITAEELQNYMKKFPATIGVGGATPAASGAGITFPATVSASSDANTLDDYEEGTFAPVFSWDGTATDRGSSYVTQLGRYTKIGRMVFFFLDIEASTISSGASSFASISGLPFPSAGDCYFPVATNRDSNAATVSSGDIFKLWVNASTTYLYGSRDSLTTNVAGPLANWDASGRVNCSGMYFV
jgi:hypothetical protein